jgi:dUTP pyrophosphatase
MDKEVIKFYKTREVISPYRAYPNDAGIDFFVPKFTKEFITDLKAKNPFLNSEPINTNSYNGELSLNGNSGTVTYRINDENNSFFKFDEKEAKNYFVLLPHQKVLIPSGIHSRMQNHGRALIAANKSGIASKYGLVFGAQIVDSSYQGEIHINVINTSTRSVRIYEDMKLIQFIETPVFTNTVEIYDKGGLTKFYDGHIEDRGSGGFGSTDKKVEQLNS